MMKNSRKWQTFPTKFGQEFVGPAGAVSSAGATVLAIVGGLCGSGIILGTAPITLAITGVGTLMGVLGLAHVAWSSVPAKLRHASELLGQRISLAQLDALQPRVLKLGVVGHSRSGKSTLISKLLQQTPPKERTQGVRAYLAALQTSPIRYVALIDGSGEEYAEQFSVAGPADFLCVVIDHNDSSTDTIIDLDRIRESVEFQRQMRGYLKSLSNTEHNLQVHLLLNKRDLWQLADASDQSSLTASLEALVKEWKDSNLAAGVSSTGHSNMDSSDIVNLVQLIVDHSPRLS